MDEGNTEEISLEEAGSGKRRRRRWIKWALLSLLFLFLFAVAGIGGTIYYFSRDLPELDSLGSYEPSQATRIYSDDNRVIGQFFIEKRVFVPLSKMPKALFQAILAVEDARFYEHNGFDYLRIIKAFVTNLENFKIRQGASTITQQLARSLFLTPERTMKRKFKEILLARKMETFLTKDQILEIYLNQIYFGHGAYGVQVASRTYFGKDVGDLTLAEAAFLAGLPKAPNDYSPYRAPDKAKFRQGVVLKRMVDEGFITSEQYHKAYQQDLFFQKLLPEEELALHFQEHIRQYLIARYGDDAVYKGGLNVYTTLNIEMQRSANRAVKLGLRELDKRQGYRGPIGKYQGSGGEGAGGVGTAGLAVGEILDGRVVAVGPAFATVQAGKLTGKILLEDMIWAAKRLKGPRLREDAQIIENAKPPDILKVDDLIRVKVKKLGTDAKGTLFSLEQEPIVEAAFIALDPATGAVKAMVGGYDFKRSEFNRALTSRRQPGSAFKPLIYATALERGLTPATLLVDNPVIFTDTELNKVWKPENYEEKFYGPITLRDALTYSRNLATVKLLEQIGIGNVVEFARRAGIRSPLTRDLSLALGSSGVSLLELASAYAVFANQGVRVEPALIASVTDNSGRVLESREISPVQVTSKETAYVVTNILEDVVQRGTARKAKVLGRPVAGKTGTTNEFTDAWFVGFTPNLVAGVWVGFDDNRPLGDREAGGTAALPIWITFMEEALSRFPVTPFSIPDNIVYAKIDRETGLLAPEEEKGSIEIFVKGTEPKEYKVESPQPTQFFKFDEEVGSF
ncbi:MAG TPA: PBP1A family penicillin-binding protein [Candidatus Manganitrophaceae bacterium]|nr:PBP1A family penicillin-binding protein [Candidatus Manganitrophaceae bacterium]